MTLCLQENVISLYVGGDFLHTHVNGARALKEQFLHRYLHYLFKCFLLVCLFYFLTKVAN